MMRRRTAATTTTRTNNNRTTTTMTLIEKLQYTSSHLNQNNNNNGDDVVVVHHKRKQKRNRNLSFQKSNHHYQVNEGDYNNNKDSSYPDWNNRYLIPSSPSSQNNHNHHPSNQKRYFLISSKVSKSLLSQHEYNARNSNKHNKQKNNHTNNSNNNNSYAKLYKPMKPTKLLLHALTNVNGMTWDRQRYCVSRAFGSKSSQLCRRNANEMGVQRVLYHLEKYHRIHSLESSSTTKECRSRCRSTGWEEVLQEQHQHTTSPFAKYNFFRRRRRNKSTPAVPPSSLGIDIREIALDIAIHSISIATLGKSSVALSSSSNSNNNKPMNDETDCSNNIIETLQKMFLPTLVPRSKRHCFTNNDKKDLQQCTNDLNDIVTRAVEEISTYIQQEDHHQQQRETPKVEEKANFGTINRTKTDNEHDCLIYQLLQYELNDDNNENNNNNHAQKQYYLERKEVISNAHSALLAGTQTICTTITNVLAHLASRNDLIDELRRTHLLQKDGFNDDDSDSGSDSEKELVMKLSSRDVVMEALRLLPPVAGLPRIPTACDIDLNQFKLKSERPQDGDSNGHDSDNDDEGKEHCIPSSSCPIRSGDEIIIDLTACSHLNDDNYHNINEQEEEEQQQQHISSSDIECPVMKNKKNKNESKSFMTSLQFDPTKKENDYRAMGSPWGMGCRKCPAGLLSVECIASILDALIENGYKWHLVDETNDGIDDKDGVTKWLKESISYVPTLSYNRPILVHFVKEDLIDQSVQ